MRTRDEPKTQRRHTNTLQASLTFKTGFKLELLLLLLRIAAFMQHTLAPRPAMFQRRYTHVAHPPGGSIVIEHDASPATVSAAAATVRQKQPPPTTATANGHNCSRGTRQCDGLFARPSQTSGRLHVGDRASNDAAAAATVPLAN